MSGERYDKEMYDEEMFNQRLYENSFTCQDCIHYLRPGDNDEMAFYSEKIGFCEEHYIFVDPFEIIEEDDCKEARKA